MDSESVRPNDLPQNQDEWIDPIVEEIREIRRKLSEPFGGDVHAMFEDLRRLEKESGRDYVSYPPRPPQIGPAPPATEGSSQAGA